MENLINYLLQFGHLNPRQIELVKSQATIKRLNREAFYFEAGNVQREVAFLTQGIIRICYYNRDGDEVTKYFLDEANFVVDVNSYTQQIPSAEYAQAITDCELVIISREAMQDLSMTIIEWDAIINRVTAKGLADKINKISPMLTEDATERYLNFMQKFPKFAHRIPLTYLASFLGITPSSLSRIRKQISP